MDSNEKADSKRYKRLQRVYQPKNPPYEASEQINAAIDTAVSLGKPLLVSGEPGVGKTRLAEYIARRFGLFEADGETAEVLRFDIKSTTKGSDLIYRYDAIRHFRDSQIARPADQAPSKEVDYYRYLELSALGTAIALGNGPIEYTNRDLAQIVKDTVALYPDTGGPRISVVLIDEIDKAPRDVPNDLLREIEDMSAPIPELGPNVHLPRPEFRFRPIVVITTNDERALPDAFLRRCCFLHIPFPSSEDDEGLKRIIQKRLGLAWSERNLAGASIKLVHELREEAKLSKKPSTAELIDFILELRNLGVDDTVNFLATDRPDIHKHALKAAHAIFAKSETDLERISKAIAQLGE